MLVRCSSARLLGEPRLARGLRVPVVQQLTQGGRVAGSRTAESNLVQRLGKFQGRLREALRREQVHANLQAQLHRHRPPEIFGLRDWRRRMEAGGKPATRWLHNRACALPAAVMDTVEGVTARGTTTRASLELLRDFWWRAAVATPRWDAAVTSIQAVDMLQRARTMKHSSAGPDGITGQEVADLPLRFWELLAERLEVWQAAGQYPEVWKHARTVFLPKDEEARTGGATEAARMRPISVFWVHLPSCDRCLDFTRGHPQLTWSDSSRLLPRWAQRPLSSPCGAQARCGLDL